jgi:DC-STAMP-like protein
MSDVAEDIWDTFSGVRSVYHFLSFRRIMFMGLLYSGSLLIFKACKFHTKFLNNIRYKNSIINKDFKILDKTHFEMTKQSILPLRSYEKSRYLELNWKPSWVEIKKIIVNFNFLVLMCLMIGIILFIDESLYFLVQVFQYSIKTIFEDLEKVDDFRKIFNIILNLH